MTVQAASAAASTAIPFKPSTPEMAALGDGWWALVLALVVLAAAAVLLRRRAGFARFAGKARRLNIVESTRLDERTRLSVVHYRGREMVVAHGDGRATVLADAAIVGAEPQP
jgi:flagellar biogenesis protein FliO